MNSAPERGASDATRAAVASDQNARSTEFVIVRTSSKPAVAASAASQCAQATTADGTARRRAAMSSRLRVKTRAALSTRAGGYAARSGQRGQPSSQSRHVPGWAQRPVMIHWSCSVHTTGVPAAAISRNSHLGGSQLLWTMCRCTTSAAAMAARSSSRRPAAGRTTSVPTTRCAAMLRAARGRDVTRSDERASAPPESRPPGP